MRGLNREQLAPDAPLAEPLNTVQVALRNSPDDLHRDVYNVLGIPIDAVDIRGVWRHIEIAVETRTPYLISTPNLNYLVNSQVDAEFRASLLFSRLCPADGMPLVWIAKLIGVRNLKRVPGSDMFGAASLERPLKVLFFGSTERVAAAAAKTIETMSPHLKCVGWVCPGFGTLVELSRDALLDEVNSTAADFLVVALGAKKGQQWLLHNHHRLRIPVRAHLGATINFLAGEVVRAPRLLQKTGTEWLWRIWQEPYLWKRYWRDGWAFCDLLLRRVFPLAVLAQLQRAKLLHKDRYFSIEQSEAAHQITLRLSGFAIADQVEKMIAAFESALAFKKSIVLDLSETRSIDARVLGLILMLRKAISETPDTKLMVANPGNGVRKLLYLHGVDYLLSAEDESGVTQDGQTPERAG